MILATNNKGKLEEIRKILNEYEIYSLKDRSIEIEVLEDQDSFYKNALKKAKEIYEITHEATIADDSGLSINCLDGFPGVMTHRFLGEDATDRMRNDYLIKEVNKHDDRRAQVVCSLIYYDGKNTVSSEGILDGSISRECRGTNGFGFDEIFELSNGLTLAEIPSSQKNLISARALAAKDLKKKLGKIKN